MVFNKNVNLSNVEEFENNVLQEASNLAIVLLLKDEVSKRKWNFEMSVYRNQNDLKKYCSYLIINIFDQNNKSISEIDESNCDLMLCETICFVNRRCVNGIDLTTDKEFLESLENLVSQVKNMYRRIDWLVRKRVLVISIVLSISWAIPLILFVLGKKDYLYPTLSFDMYPWAISYLCTTILGITFLLLIKFRKTKRFFSILLVLSLIPQYFLDVVFLSGFYISNWQSKTEDVSNFGKIDYSCENNVEISNLKLSEIMKDPKKVNSYSYQYAWGMFVNYFDIYFDYELSKERYDFLKGRFQETMNCENSKISGEGKFVVSEDTPTSVDEWDEMYIYYNDNSCRLIVKLKGSFET